MKDLDEEGKLLITLYLERKGWEVIDTDNFNKHCRHDLEAIKGNKKIYIEIKKRKCTSTEWGDVIVQQDKFDYLKQFENSYVINIFTDDKIYCADIHSTPHEVQHRFCQRTNNWDTTKTSKVLISFKIEDCKEL